VTRIIRFGSRKSRLALIQTQLVMDAVTRAHPDIRAELVTMDTSGDRDMRPFSDSAQAFGIKGLFTKELEDALRNGDIDVAVHSFKDMPSKQGEGLAIVALSHREDPRDALVPPKEGVLPRNGASVGCSSARRRLQFGKLVPDIGVEPVRGNVQTRLRKLDEGQFLSLILAAAGLKRLGLAERIFRYYTADEMTPSPGQGIMACQGRVGEAYEYLDAVRDKKSEICAAAERSFSDALGGGCTAPVGAYAEIEGRRLLLRGFYADEAAGIYRKGRMSGAAGEAAEIGKRLAAALREGTEEA